MTVEELLESNRVEYTISNHDNDLIAKEVRYYNIPTIGNTAFINWYPYSKDGNKNIPLDTCAYYAWILDHNPQLKKPDGKYMGEDVLRILELRHIGLYSSIKNFARAKGRTNPAMKQACAVELEKTTKMIKAVREKLGNERLADMRNNTFRNKIFWQQFIK